MTRRTGLIVCVVATLLAGQGCVTCGHKGFGLAYKAGPGCDVPACQRNKVYLFAVSGMTPPGVSALETLCTKLGERGYAKVAAGQVVHAPWMASEMRRIHAEDPDAVFVIAGCEAGGPVAVKLAEYVTGKDVPVAAVVLLDAEGKTAAPAWGVRTVLVGGYPIPSEPSATSSVPVTTASRFGIAADPAAVDAVVGLLNGLAAGVRMPTVAEPAEWSYPHAPPMRPLAEPAADPEWAFLFDASSGMPRAIGDPAATTTAKVPVPATATAARRP